MYTDKTLTCRDCGQAFIFTAGEQEFFASRGFSNDPSRCPECRAERKRNQADGNHRGGYERREREMFPAVCSQCGVETQVPFQPRLDRPVYCSDCYALVQGRSFRTSGSRGGRW